MIMPTPPRHKAMIKWPYQRIVLRPMYLEAGTPIMPPTIATVFSIATEVFTEIGNSPFDFSIRF